MAALDDSLTHFEGQRWSLLAERLGMSSPTSDSEDEENTKVRRESTTTRLKKEEMAIYGYCPRWEDFYLVVCDVCGRAVKPQALKQHIELRHGGLSNPVKSSGGTKSSVSSGSKSSKTRNRAHTINPVVKLEGRIDSSESLVGDRTSQVAGESGINSSSINSGRTGVLPESPVCELLPSPSGLALSQLKTEVKTEESLDSGPTLVPPPQPLPTSLPPPAPPEPQHPMPHPISHAGPPPSVGPPSIGPPSVGPPSVGPPSVGPPSVGPPSVGPPSVSCPSATHPSLTTYSVPPATMAGTALAGVHIASQSVSSVEEEVNKISAMLQAEAEALTASQNLIASSNMDMGTGIVGTHDIVEAQGLAGGSVTSNGSSLSAGPGGMISNSQAMGSVPVPMSHMSMATLNQIQADLLATVSESDLNAVLNATPDSSDLAQNVLPNNSQCYLNESGNITYLDQQTVNTDNYVEPPHLSNQNVLPQQYNNEQLSMPVLEQITKEVLSEADPSTHNFQAVSGGVQGQYTNTTQSDLIEVPVDSFSFDEIEKISSQCDELTKAVNSISQLCQQGGNSGLESQLAGLLQQPSSTPAPSPSPGATGIPVGNSISAAPTLGTTATSQGITVVIGAGAQPSATTVTTQPSLSMPTLAATLKKPVVSTAGGQHLVSPGPATSTHTPSHTPTHTPSHTPTHTPTQHTTTSSNTTLTPVPPTPSPKKSNKKKKPGERKLLPLKDREYDPEVHCGVVVAETGKPCTRSLTCKTHSLSLRRAVPGRSKKFDDLLLEHRAAKEAQTRAAKPPDAAAGQIQGTPPRGPAMATTSSGGMVVGGAAATSPLLVKTLGGTAPTLVAAGDPSPNPTLHHPMDPPSTPSHIHATPPSPAYWPPTPRIAPALVPADNFYVREPPKPLATCSYNCRRLGGHLATDHRADLLRSAFRNALKKPHPASVLSDSSISNTLNIGGTQDRFVNVKPLLAKKLQLTVPSGSASKDGISVSTGYNGHIHVGNSMGIVNSSALAATLKRPTQPDALKNNATPITSAKNKNKKVKTNDGAINIVGNVLQLDTGGSKNHIPVVVSLQNGLSNTQTITLSNVAIAGVRNSTTQPIRINPSTTTTLVRDAQVTDARPGSSDSTNIVLPSGIVISDALAKSFKSDSAGSIRLELHSNTFGDASRLVTNTAKVSGSGITNTVGSGGAVGGVGGGGSSTVGGGVAPGSTAGLAPGQVTYLTSAVPGGGGTPGLTLRQVHQECTNPHMMGVPSTLPNSLSCELCQVVIMVYHNMIWHHPGVIGL
ncbi:mucin-2-like [Penaeus indicus]|uniref:mucin-2-like n=1 Tax=Penaeus indicus TaxID=29960 RepID=UPI00300C8B7F